MSKKTLFTVSEIARAKVTGKTSQTVRRELKNKKATVETKGKTIYVDLSELMRIYTADELDVLALSDHAPKTAPQIPTVTSEAPVQPTPDHQASIELLNEKLNFSNDKINQYEKDIDYLKQTVDKALDNQAKTTLLLKDYTKENNSHHIDSALKTLEQRILKQEQTSTEHIKEKETLIQQQKKRTKQALAEKRDHQKTIKLLYTLTGILTLTLIVIVILYRQGLLQP